MILTRVADLDAAELESPRWVGLIPADCDRVVFAWYIDHERDAQIGGTHRHPAEVRLKSPRCVRIFQQCQRAANRKSRDEACTVTAPVNADSLSTLGLVVVHKRTPVAFEFSRASVNHGEE